MMDGRDRTRLRHLLGSLERRGRHARRPEGRHHPGDGVDEQPDRDPQRASARPSTDALDAVGPAIEVLADQHDELIAMLAALDRLGVVGTRVIGASKDDLLKTLAHLRAGAARSCAPPATSWRPGLNLLVSFPFPKEASEIVQGDYANTSIRADINLENFLPAAPAIPPIPIPAPIRSSRPRRGAQRRAEVPAVAATSPARPARRCSPTSTSLTQAEEEVQEAEVHGQPGLHGPQHGARTCRAAPTSGDLPGRPARARRSAPADDGRAHRRRTARRSTEGLVMIRGIRIRHRGVPRAERGRHRLHHRVLPRVHRQGARAAASPCTRRCPRRAGSSRAARSPTAA